jgi:hypothetical protein
VAAITYLVQVSAHLIEDINRGKQIPGLKFALDLDGVLFILKQNLHVGDSSVPGARTRPHLDCPWGHAQEYWAVEAWGGFLSWCRMDSRRWLVF